RVRRWPGPQTHAVGARASPRPAVVRGEGGAGSDFSSHAGARHPRNARRAGAGGPHQADGPADARWGPPERGPPQTRHRSPRSEAAGFQCAVWDELDLGQPVLFHTGGELLDRRVVVAVRAGGAGVVEAEYERSMHGVALVEAGHSRVDGDLPVLVVRRLA